MSVLPAVAVVGWTHRNVSCCNVSTIATAGANDLYRFKAAAVVALSEHESFDVAQHQLDLALPPNVRPGNDPDEVERRAMRIFRERPIAVARMTAKSAAVLLFVPAGTVLSRMLGFDWRASNPGGRKEDIQPVLSSLFSDPGMLLLVVFQIVYCLVIAVGIVLALINVREMNAEQRRLVLLCALMAMVLLAPNVGGAAKFRMRSPAAPAMVILAAIGLRRFSRALRFESKSFLPAPAASKSSQSTFSAFKSASVPPSASSVNATEVGAPRPLRGGFRSKVC
ncbi:MAG: hypothetical protein WBQ86_00170 [Candidatus Binatus sp.]